MEARAKGHARIEREDDVPGRPPVSSPGRPDDEPAPDAHDREVGLPGIRPVGFVDQTRAQLADRPQTEGLEMPERLGDLGHGAIRGGAVAGRHVGADRGRPGGIDPGAQTLVDEVEGGLDRGAAGGGSTEDLTDGLDRFDVRLDREFEPRVSARPHSRPSRTQPSPSFSRRPPPACETVSPASSA